MSPQNQQEMLEQTRCADRFVLADTMDLWINIANDDLKELLKKIDLLVLNDSEARLYTGTRNLITAGHRLLEHGPKHVVIKKGEHGALVFGPDGQFFSAGAYPLHTVVDPTGAGDSFLGGTAGHIAANSGGDPSFADIARAVVHGTVIASFNCESFSADRMLALSADDIAARTDEFRRFTSF